jgi:hypothetical protein
LRSSKTSRGVFALRGKPPGTLPDPDVILYGTVPLLRLDEPGTVRILRLDQTADAVTVSVAAGANPVTIATPALRDLLVSRQPVVLLDEKSSPKCRCSPTYGDVAATGASFSR